MTEYEQRQYDLCKDPVNGPLYFCNTFLVHRNPYTGIAPVNLKEHQIELIKRYSTGDNVVSLLPRQSGKTFASLGYLLWCSQFNETENIGITACSELHSIDFFADIRTMYEGLPDYLKIPYRRNHRRGIIFENGSQIVIHTGTKKTFSNDEITLLYCDEFTYMRSDFFISLMDHLPSLPYRTLLASSFNYEEDCRTFFNKAVECGFVPYEVSWI